MPGLVTAIHVLATGTAAKTWMAGTSPAMTGVSQVNVIGKRFKLAPGDAAPCPGDGINDRMIQ
jgi:hypothetical protein